MTWPKTCQIHDIYSPCRNQDFPQVSPLIWPMLNRFWDWTSGNNFQAGQTIVQPGSMESEAGIFACGFDASGSRLLTAEADKTIKFWKEDANATPDTHPVNFRPPKDIRRF